MMLAWTQIDVCDGDGKNRTDLGYVLEAEWAGRGDTQDVGNVIEKRKKKEFVKQLGEQKYHMERWRQGSLWGGGALDTQVHCTDDQRS